MHNIIILGTGRSGTSLVTSLFRNAGCYCGDNYIPPRVSNPSGFFEDSVINRINDEILRILFFTRYLRRLPKPVRPRLLADVRALWLAAPRFVLPQPLPERICAEMRERASHEPFCFKDPRFSITLRYWRPCLPLNTRFIVVFRNPHATVESMVREAEEGYTPPIEFSVKEAYTVWRRSYKKLLSERLEGESWLFVNYDDVLNRSALPAIAAFAGAKLDSTVIDPGLNRRSGARVASLANGASRGCDALFAALQARAEESKRPGETTGLLETTTRPSPYRMAVGAWEHLPRAIRQLVRNHPLLDHLKRDSKKLASLFLSRDDIYDEKYYELVEGYAKRSAEAIAADIVQEFHPATVCDVGCGTGALLEALRNRGVGTEGIEYSESAVKLCLARGLLVRKFDLTKDPIPAGLSADVAISMEVAEHLPAWFADRYVHFLCKIARVVVFTAATPGQGGTDHVNEQPHEYWVEKFAALGFAFQAALSEQWRVRWKENGVAWFYCPNLMVFVRSDEAAPRASADRAV